MSQKTPLFKGQGFRLASIGVGLVVGLGIVLVVRAATSDAPLSSGFLLGGGAAGLIIAVVAVVVGLLLGRRIFGQRLEIALRTAGEKKWQHGRVEASPGRLRFRRYKWQLRFISGEPVDFLVDEVGADSGARPSKKQMWSVNPSLHVIEVKTDRGTLQLGVQSHQVNDVLSQLQPVTTAS
jgi:hypothetical protein